MEKNDHHIKYPTDYLRRYLNGELTDKEMQALEKDALEDPFLADTIEGLEESRDHSVSFESGVADLQKRLSERAREQKRKKEILFMSPRWRAVAAVLILGGLSTVAIILLNLNSSQKTIALANKKDSQQVRVTITPLTTSPKSDSVQIITNSNSDEPGTLAEAHRQVKKAQPVKITPTAPASEQEMKIGDDQQSDLITKTETPGTKKRDSVHFVQGFVLDDSGKAIPYADVNLSGQNKNTLTDANGYFKLYVENNKKDQEIAIHGLGYNSIKSTVQPDSSILNFKLSNSSKHLNEVVVVALGVSKKRGVTGFAANSESKNLQPGGWKALNDYINDNKQINSADSVLKGEEIISFDLNKKGKLSSFKVIKSISPSHDDEIIRLLKSGPQLKPAAGKKQKCQISILFN